MDDWTGPWTKEKCIQQNHHHSDQPAKRLCGVLESRVQIGRCKNSLGQVDKRFDSNNKRLHSIRRWIPARISIASGTLSHTDRINGVGNSVADSGQSMRSKCTSETHTALRGWLVLNLFRSSSSLSFVPM